MVPAEGVAVPKEQRTRAVLSSSKDISASQSDRNALFLNGTWLLKALLVDSHEQLTLEHVILKLVAFGCCDILRATTNSEKHTPRQ